jgi:ubiquinone biosynthesis protein Coq4
MKHFKLADIQKLWNSIHRLWHAIVNHGPFQLSVFATVQLHIKHLVNLLMQSQIVH